MVKAQDGAGRAGGRCGLRDAENKTNGNSGSESFQPRCRRGTAARLPPDGATPAPPEPSKHPGCLHSLRKQGSLGMPGEAGAVEG